MSETVASLSTKFAEHEAGEFACRKTCARNDKSLHGDQDGVVARVRLLECGFSRVEKLLWALLSLVGTTLATGILGVIFLALDFFLNK